MLGIIGGTGLYEFLEDAQELTVETPYGAPSDVITKGHIGQTEVAFLPRHGKDHQWPPHKIPYRANLWALRSLGVRKVLSPCAVGSLQPGLQPGTFVTPDQVVDRTFSRPHTYIESGLAHVAFTEPYCGRLRSQIGAAGEQAGVDVVSSGTMVVIEGPRFSSKAESQHYAGNGWQLINMTGMPEAALAREQALCYSPIALVTDMDAGVGGAPAVTQAEAVRNFRANISILRTLVTAAVDTVGADQTECPCQDALAGMPQDHLPPSSEA